MELIGSILGCLGFKPDHESCTSTDDCKRYQYTDEKTIGFSPYHDEDEPRIDERAAEFVQNLLKVDKINDTARMELRSLFFSHPATHAKGIHTDSWYESLAAAILEHLEAALQTGAELNATMKDAVGRATLAAQAVGFVKEHPVFCTLIAIGVLVIIAPWVLEALGFAEIGIVEGSWAALWQRQFAGFVPKGSLFSMLQRLGMTWAH